MILAAQQALLVLDGRPDLQRAADSLVHAEYQTAVFIDSFRDDPNAPDPEDFSRALTSIDTAMSLVRSEVAVEDLGCGI